jgi:hypothetical protein
MCRTEVEWPKKKTIDQIFLETLDSKLISLLSKAMKRQVFDYIVEVLPLHCNLAKQLIDEGVACDKGLKETIDYLTHNPPKVCAVILKRL